MPRFNLRKISKHRAYTVAEIARAVGCTVRTVRRWITSGLPVLRDQRPALILGSDLIDFHSRRQRPKTRCELHECYCMSCRAPRPPAFGEVEFFPDAPTHGNMRALCAECSTVMHKRVANADLAALEAIVVVTVVEGDERLNVHQSSSLNDHFPTQEATP